MGSGIIPLLLYFINSFSCSLCGNLGLESLLICLVQSLFVRLLIMKILDGLLCSQGALFRTLCNCFCLSNLLVPLGTVAALCGLIGRTGSLLFGLSLAFLCLSDLLAKLSGGGSIFSVSIGGNHKSQHLCLLFVRKHLGFLRCLLCALQSLKLGLGLIGCGGRSLLLALRLRLGVALIRLCTLVTLVCSCNRIVQRIFLLAYKLLAILGLLCLFALLRCGKSGGKGQPRGIRLLAGFGIILRIFALYPCVFLCLSCRLGSRLCKHGILVCLMYRLLIRAFFSKKLSSFLRTGSGLFGSTHVCLTAQVFLLGYSLFANACLCGLLTRRFFLLCGGGNLFLQLLGGLFFPLLRICGKNERHQLGLFCIGKRFGSFGCGLNTLQGIKIIFRILDLTLGIQVFAAHRDALVLGHLFLGSILQKFLNILLCGLRTLKALVGFSDLQLQSASLFGCRVCTFLRLLRLLMLIQNGNGGGKSEQCTSCLLARLHALLLLLVRVLHAVRDLSCALCLILCLYGLFIRRVQLLLGGILLGEKLYALSRGSRFLLGNLRRCFGLCDLALVTQRAARSPNSLFRCLGFALFGSLDFLLQLLGGLFIRFVSIKRHNERDHLRLLLAGKRAGALHCFLCGIKRIRAILRKNLFLFQALSLCLSRCTCRLVSLGFPKNSRSLLRGLLGLLHACKALIGGLDCGIQLLILRNGSSFGSLRLSFGCGESGGKGHHSLFGFLMLCGLAAAILLLGYRLSGLRFGNRGALLFFGSILLLYSIGVFSTACRFSSLRFFFIRFIRGGKGQELSLSLLCLRGLLGRRAHRALIAYVCLCNCVIQLLRCAAFGGCNDCALALFRGHAEHTAKSKHSRHCFLMRICTLLRAVALLLGSGGRFSRILRSLFFEEHLLVCMAQSILVCILLHQAVELRSRRIGGTLCQQGLGLCICNLRIPTLQIALHLLLSLLMRLIFLFGNRADLLLQTVCGLRILRLGNSHRKRQHFRSLALGHNAGFLGSVLYNVQSGKAFLRVYCMLLQGHAVSLCGTQSLGIFSALRHADQRLICAQRSRFCIFIPLARLGNCLVQLTAIALGKRARIVRRVIACHRSGKGKHRITRLTLAHKLRVRLLALILNGIGSASCAIRLGIFTKCLTVCLVKLTVTSLFIAQTSGLFTGIFCRFLRNARLRLSGGKALLPERDISPIFFLGAFSGAAFLFTGGRSVFSQLIGRLGVPAILCHSRSQCQHCRLAICGQRGGLIRGLCRTLKHFERLLLLAGLGTQCIRLFLCLLGGRCIRIQSGQSLCLQHSGVVLAQCLLAVQSQSLHRKIYLAALLHGSTDILRTLLTADQACNCTLLTYTHLGCLFIGFQEACKSGILLLQL